MNVELRSITKDNWRDAYRLTRTLTDEQQNFVAPNAYSILQTLYDDDGEWHMRGIYEGDTMVGFSMFGYLFESKQYWINRLMMGGEHQRKGYGRAGMLAIIEALKAMPNCNRIFISFEPDNAAARALYASLGFEDTGKIEDGEAVFVLGV